jgi:hypothetical protein
VRGERLDLETLLLKPEHLLHVVVLRRTNAYATCGVAISGGDIGGQAIIISHGIPSRIMIQRLR